MPLNLPLAETMVHQHLCAIGQAMQGNTRPAVYQQACFLSSVWQNNFLICYGAALGCRAPH